MSQAGDRETHQTDLEWQRWGELDPYFGVITHDRFRRRNLTPESLAEFFESGRQHVEHVLKISRRHLYTRFEPRRALDFGCGVGRVLAPLAQRVHEVVGMDVSPAMLDEARRNCLERGLANVTLVPSDDELSALTGDFDLIHSVLVLQHIEPARGRAIVGRLLNRLRPGGVAALHVTYGKAYHADRLGVPPPPAPPPPPSSASRWSLKRLAGSGAAASGAEAPARDPVMHMYAYPLNELLFLVQQAGVRRSFVEFTDHGGELGVFLFLHRQLAA